MYIPYNDPKKGRSAIINPAVAGAPGTVGNPVQPVVYIGQFVPNTGDVSNGVVVNTDPTFPTSLRNSNGLLVAPRLGFAYDVDGDGKTAFRGGVGLFYNTREGGGTVGDYSLISPIVNNPVQNYGDARQFAGGCSGSACSGGILLTSPQATRILQLDRPIESVLSTTLGVQRAVGFQTVVDIAYVGTFGRHLSEEIDLNKVPYLSHFQPQNLDQTLITKPTIVLGGIKQFTPLSDNFFRPIPGFTNVNLRKYAGISSYHSLQTQITRRFSKGLTFGVVYTWSEAMTDADSVDGAIATYQNHRFWDYGEASFDRTNNFVAHWNWDLPKGSTLWSNFATRTVLDNWQFSGIGQLVSGIPTGITLTLSGIDLTGGGDGARAIVTHNPVLPKSKRTVNQYFDASAFVLPTYGQIPGPDTPGIVRNKVFRGPERTGSIWP